MTAGYISEKCGQVTIRTQSSMMPLQPLFSPIFNNGRQYSQTRTNTQRPLMLPDELLRLDNSQEIVLFRGHKPLQLYKITPEELPDFGKLRPVRVTDYIPAWRKLDADKAAEAREKRARRQEAAQATPPQGGEARQPPAPPRDARPVPVQQPIAQAPRAETLPPVFHAREDDIQPTRPCAWYGRTTDPGRGRRTPPMRRRLSVYARSLHSKSGGNMQEFMRTTIKRNPGKPTPATPAGNLAMGLLQFAGTIPQNPGNTERFVTCLMAGADMDDNLGLYDMVMLMVRRWAGKQDLDGCDARVIEESRKICDVMGWMPLEV